MKRTGKVLAILLVLSLIIGCLSFVNAATDKLSISKRKVTGNVVTFTINLPEGTVLVGDLNSDGKLDDSDLSILNDYNNKKLQLTEIQKKTGDLNFSGSVDHDDAILLGKWLEKTVPYTPITINGTLAKDSTYKMSKETEKTYKVEVTVPADKEGDVGITVNKNIFAYDIGVGNEETPSEKVSVSARNIKINDGIKEENKVKFKIDIPEGTVLRGDVNLNGKIDDEDLKTLSKFLNNQTYPINELPKKAADAYVDGEHNTQDAELISEMLLGTVPGHMRLDGTLASKSKGELVKDSNGNYYIEVTIQEDSKEGTIGVTLLDEAFMFDVGVASGETSSKLFSLSNTDNEEFKVEETQVKTDDGKVKVTLKTNKELDKDKIPEGWKLLDDGKSIEKIMEKGTKVEVTLVAKDGSTHKHTVVIASDADGKKDDTTAKTKIPQTGVKNTVIFIIAGVVIAGTVIFIKSRKMTK